MKRLLIVLAAALVLCGAAMAQTQPPAGNAQPTGPAPLKGVKAPPQAKSQEEYNEYLSAIQLPDLNQAELAAQQFAAKFPQSQLTSGLFMRLMFDNIQANNADKAIDMGRQVLKIEPTNPVAAIYTATLLAETARDTDIDAAQKFDEAAKDVNVGLQNVDTNLMVAGNLTQDQVEQNRTDLKARAYEALGLIAIKKKDYAGAEKNLRQSIQTRGGTGEALTHLRLAIALDNQQKYAEALTEATKAQSLASPEQPVSKQAQMEIDRLKKLVPGAGGAAPAASGAPAGAPPTPQATTPR